MGFFVNKDGSGDGQAGEILEYFEKYGILTHGLEIVGLDGTSANTGYKVKN
jgi:hypothetical protein